MKAGIITHYNVHNHGAQLQLYALSKQLGRFGYDAKALTYKKNYDYLELGIENKYNISFRSVPYYVGYLFSKGIGRTLYNYNKRKTLNHFRWGNNLEGEYYSKAADLDVIVLGSDEIFSIEPGLNPCFWGMGVPCDKVISYAASCGPTDEKFIREHYADEFITAGINRIDAISVRDRNTYNIIKVRTDKDVTIVCDPVLLYDFVEERSVAKRPTEKKYCIVYSYDNNMNDDETVNTIRNYAKKCDFEVYSVGYYHKWCDKNINLTPLELFPWFENAECVFTDTFHGTIVSLVCNAEFVTKISGNGNKLGFLLEQYGVTERRVATFADIPKIISEKIDYTVVNKRIEESRTQSLDFLKSAVGGSI